MEGIVMPPELIPIIAVVAGVVALVVIVVGVLSVRSEKDLVEATRKIFNRSSSWKRRWKTKREKTAKRWTPSTRRFPDALSPNASGSNWHGQILS
jgi:hypothetical protein